MAFRRLDELADLAEDPHLEQPTHRAEQEGLALRCLCVAAGAPAAVGQKRVGDGGLEEERGDGAGATAGGATDRSGRLGEPRQGAEVGEEPRTVPPDPHAEIQRRISR